MKRRGYIVTFSKTLLILLVLNPIHKGVRFYNFPSGKKVFTTQISFDASLAEGLKLNKQFHKNIERI